MRVESVVGVKGEAAHLLEEMNCTYKYKELALEKRNLDPQTFSRIFQDELGLALSVSGLSLCWTLDRC